MSTANNAAASFMSTRKAAERLGVALSTIQLWVETGVLPAWKTAGGHRRIPRAAIEAMAQRQQATLAGASAPAALRVLVVDDDPVQIELYRHTMDGWDLPLDLLVATDGFDGLLQAGRHRPDLIIADLSMPGMDGIMMIRRLRSQAGADSPAVIVVTALGQEEIRARGGLPADTPVFAKPIPFAVLRPIIENRIRQFSARMP